MTMPMGNCLDASLDSHFCLDPGAYFVARWIETHSGWMLVLRSSVPMFSQCLRRQEPNISVFSKSGIFVEIFPGSRFCLPVGVIVTYL